MSGIEHDAIRDPLAGANLSPAVRAQLLDPPLWQEGLKMYARATNLAVTLTDASGRPLGECINPQPTWSLFHGRKPADTEACPFTLLPLAPCTCVADALAKGDWHLARDRTGLVHFAVPLVLGEMPLGALVAGQVFDWYSDQQALELVAKHFGLSPGNVWQLARLEHPVKPATLRVYADLLKTLADHTLRSRYFALMEADRLTEITRLNEQLGEADRRKDEFLAMLAHELRNPLAPICNALHLLQLTTGDAEIVGQATAMMQRQVGQMVRLIDDLLDVGRISRGKIELRKGRVELASVVNHVVEAVRPLCKTMDLELTVTLPPRPLVVNGDPLRLTQVVGNLLTNACKFTDRGGHVWLTVEQASGGCQPLGEAVIRVRDTGIGIAANQLSRIFEIFTQVDTSLERARSGLGIGLTLAKNLVEMHGGTVEVHSAGLGRGSEFVVRLPLAVEPPQPPPPKQPSGGEEVAGAARRLLVVDDNRDAAESLAILMALTGHEVQTAHDGLDAVAVAAKFRPDVVLLDIGLPKLNGFDAARRIRGLPGGKDVMLIALSGWGQEEDRRKSHEAGFDAHLVKPVDYAALQALLASLVPGRARPVGAR